MYSGAVRAGLVMDKSENLCGTTSNGGGVREQAGKKIEHAILHMPELRPNVRGKQVFGRNTPCNSLAILLSLL